MIANPFIGQKCHLSKNGYKNLSIFLDSLEATEQAKNLTIVSISGIVTNDGSGARWINVEEMPFANCFMTNFDVDI